LRDFAETAYRTVLVAAAHRTNLQNRRIDL